MEKGNHSNKQNVIMVVTSNLATILVSLIMGFVFTKYMSVEGYAYFRIYMLYVSYAGVFHFGFVNGIYLKYGHLDVDQIPLGIFRRFAKIMYLVQLLVVIALSVILFVARPSDTNEIVSYIFVIINIPLINIKWFYSSINQFTKRFVQDSVVTFVMNMSQLFMVIMVCVTRLYYYQIVLVLMTIVNLLALIMVMRQNSFIVWGKDENPEKGEVPALFKSGFFIMLSEFVATIIIGIDSIFVQNLFSISDFALYSFATSILTVIYWVIAAFSNMVYPYLVRADSDRYDEYYTLMSDFLTILASYSLLGYFVAKFIVEIWLPNYIDSMEITAILFGTIIFRVLILLVGGNFFKVLKRVMDFSKNNIFAIVLSFVANVIAYLIFRSMESIAWASFLSFVLWYAVTEFYFAREIHVPVKESLRRYIVIAAVYLAFFVSRKYTGLVAFVLYFVLDTVICLVLYWPQVKKLFAVVKNEMIKK